MEEYIENINEEEGLDLDFNYVKEISREAEKWTFDNIYYFTDRDPPKQDVVVPPWRYSWNHKAMKTIIKAYLTKFNPLRLIRDWYGLDYRIDAPETPTNESAHLNTHIIFETINELNLWTPQIVDRSIKIIFREW